MPVGEEPKRNESRGARTAVRGDQSDSSQSGDDSSDGKPPGSEDYHGEIFQEPDQDENAGSGRSGTSEADAGDQGNGGDNGQDQNVAEAPPNGYLDTIKQEEPSPPDVSCVTSTLGMLKCFLTSDSSSGHRWSQRKPSELNDLPRNPLQKHLHRKSALGLATTILPSSLGLNDVKTMILSRISSHLLTTSARQRWRGSVHQLS